MQQNLNNSQQVLNNNLNKIKFLTGNAEGLVNINKIFAKEPFNENIINFLNDLSQSLILNREAKNYSDVVTFAFWIRKSSSLKLKERFYDKNNLSLGKGVVFHVAPSNVPVNFAFSLASGLLTGNANIVKVPSKDFAQVNLIIEALNKVLNNEKYEDLKDYIYLIKYERYKEVNDLLTGLCDMRVIWGGDNTISEIRKSPLNARAGEITFADRYSIALINSNYYLNLDLNLKRKAAQDFYNDTFFSDQNACTSPRAVIWTGNKISEAKKEFWRLEHELVKNKYNFQDIQAVNKLTSFYILAADKLNVKLENEFEDNLIMRVKVKELDHDLMNYKDNSGYFFEYEVKENILEIKNLLDNKKCQTLAYLSDDVQELKDLIMSGLKGVDRIVKFGKTMDFDLIWDGYNLFSQLTRIISFE